MRFLKTIQFRLNLWFLFFLAIVIFFFSLPELLRTRPKSNEPRLFRL